MNEGYEHPLANSGIAGLPERITAAMSGYLEITDPELQTYLKKVGYKSFTPKLETEQGEINLDEDTFLERLLEAKDKTSKLPPIIRIRDSWFTRRNDIVEKVTKEYIAEAKRLEQEI